MSGLLKAAQSAMTKGLKAVGLQSSGPPPDDKLVRALTRLNALEKVIANMTKGFRAYAATVTHASASAVALSADVTRFYNDNAPRLASVKKYADAQAKIEIAATKLFDRDLHMDLLPIFADWTPEVARIKKQIQETEAARVRVYELKLKVEELRADHKRRTERGTASFEQATALQRAEEELKKHGAAYEHMFDNAERATKEIMDGRFAAFDQCYVRLLELQLEYFKAAAAATAPLQTAVDNYRKRHPKTGYAYAASPTNAATAAEVKDAADPAQSQSQSQQPQAKRPTPTPSPPASQRKSGAAPTAAELSDDELDIPQPKGKAGGEGPNGSASGVGSNGGARKSAAAQAQAASATKPPPPAGPPPSAKPAKAPVPDVFGALEGFDALRGGGAEKPDPLADVKPVGSRGDDDDSLSSLAGFAPMPKPGMVKANSFDIFGAASPRAPGAGGASAAPANPAAAAPKPATLDAFAFFGAGAAPAPAAAAKPASAAPSPSPSPAPVSASAAMGFDFSGGASSRSTAPAAAAAKPAAPPQQAKGHAYGEFDSFLNGGSSGSSSSASMSRQQSSSAAASSSSSSNGGGAEDPDMTLPGELDGPPSEVAARAAASASPLDDLDDEPPVRRAPPSQSRPAPAAGAGAGATATAAAAAAAHDPDDFTSHLRGHLSVEANAKSAAEAAIQDYQDMEADRQRTVEAKNNVSQALKDKLQNWEYKNGVQKGIRAMLSSLQSVLWPDSGWVPLSISDVTDDKKLHKYINRVRLLVHPDKQPALGAGGTPERLYTAERLNEAINSAWAKWNDNPKGKF